MDLTHDLRCVWHVGWLCPQFLGPIPTLPHASKQIDASVLLDMSFVYWRNENYIHAPDRTIGARNRPFLKSSLVR